MRFRNAPRFLYETYHSISFCMGLKTTQGYWDETVWTPQTHICIYEPCWCNSINVRKDDASYYNFTFYFAVSQFYKRAIICVFITNATFDAPVSQKQGFITHVIVRVSLWHGWATIKCESHVWLSQDYASESAYHKLYTNRAIINHIFYVLIMSVCK